MKQTYRFSKNLKNLRLEKKLSQKEFGCIIGATQSTIAKWENGEREPSIEILISIAKFFQCSLDYLIDYD